MSKEALPQALSEVRDVEDFEMLFHNLKWTLQEIKRNAPGGRIGYVAGKISSDGLERLEENRRILSEKTEKFRQNYYFPIFCANDIITPEFVEKNGHEGTPYIAFWRKVLESGLVTDVFMTLGWKSSVGATDEHTTAKINELNIVYEESDIKYKPPTGNELQDWVRSIFLPYEPEIVKNGDEKIWWKTEVDLSGGEKVTLSNNSNEMVIVKLERSDLIFQFCLEEDSILWLDGVYVEVSQDEAHTVYLKEFFEDDEGDELIEDLVSFVDTSIDRGKIMPLPEAVKRFKKTKNYTRLRL